MLPFYRAPGADDDGSGSVTCLQVLRSLVEQAFVPPSNLALEFHWFAAEEGGLLGSQDVAAAYEKEGKKIKGMLHMDSKPSTSKLGFNFSNALSISQVTAFVKKGTTPIVAFFQNQVDANLTVFATKLVDEYLPLKWNFTGCGKSCGSDHMSFYKAGFPVTFATEGLFEGRLHSQHIFQYEIDYTSQMAHLTISTPRTMTLIRMVSITLITCCNL
jgi:bacterial leucyl aminopeptidase